MQKKHFIIICSVVTITIALIIAMISLFFMLFFTHQKQAQLDYEATQTAIETEAQALLEAEQATTEVEAQALLDAEQAAEALRAEYIFPDSETQLLTLSDIQVLSEDELRIARNEIYARHGLIFQSTDLKTYFSSTSWYEETTSSVSDSDLNQYEISNIQLILSLENHYGQTEAIWDYTAYIKSCSLSNGVLTVVSDDPEYYNTASENTLSERLYIDSLPGIVSTYCIADDCSFIEGSIGESLDSVYEPELVSFEDFQYDASQLRELYLNGGFESSPGFILDVENGVVVRAFILSS